MKILHLPLSLLIASVLFTSCGKADFCTDEDAYMGAVGETIRIESCSSDKYDNFFWYFDGESVSSYFFLPQSNAKLVSGGEGCDDFVEIRFTEAGTYVVKFEANKLSSGTCFGSNEGSLGKSKSIDVIVTE